MPISILIDSQKLVSVLITSMLMIKAYKKIMSPNFKPKLLCVFCIHYLIQGGQYLVQSLIKSNNKINVMYPTVLQGLISKYMR